jgi:hypothetical protein
MGVPDVRARAILHIAVVITLALTYITVAIFWQAEIHGQILHASAGVRDHGSGIHSHA